MIPVYAELTASGHEIALVAGGPDAALIAAAKMLQTLTPLFSKSDPPGGLTVPATWPAVVQLANTFPGTWHPGPRLQAWIDDQAARRTAPLASTLSYTPPAGLVPRPYQVAGALEIARTGRALNFDEPRTGKTITTILGLVEWSAQIAEQLASDAGVPINGLRSMAHVTPVLVICPASVIDPWVEAWQAWAPHVRAVAYRGPKRSELIGTADVYVTSYETARNDAGVVTSNGKRSLRPLIDLDAAALVVDECHYVKNPQAERTKAVRRLAERNAARGGAFVALSGTPITKHMGEIFPALSCLEPGAYPSSDRWKKRYCWEVQGEYDTEIIGLNPALEAEFRLTLLGQHRRVAREDVMAELPPKVYSTRTVELPAKWRKAYDDFEAQMLAELPDQSDGSEGELAVMDVLTKYNLLTRLASAPADVEYTYGPDVYADGHPQAGDLKRHIHLHLKNPSWKVDALLEILAERCEPGRRTAESESVVAFAPSKQLMMLAGAAATKAGYRVGYIVGGQSAGERTAARLAFQRGELDLICATTGAGGAGITLSRAGTLVFLQRPWSLDHSIQAEDRGEGDLNATRGTEIIDVIAKNTIESRIRTVLRENAGQLADLVQDQRIVEQLLGGADRSREGRAA